ncbi:hypothetical protein A3A67_02855 [Candidatus Peribacteria bacterium RIFCSPLOWO2_01_FULL_51_18]|nr:MAG: hypothetical protein A3C52_03470 [Candidatus Peribacteria bacterium RIFCSPHIGHO2_02_FULL_51_15]OGJ66497.1 MAG: hypothetical protein A3A67_02855 [Candidatus Peribacteria bacterium RIFCSPLOWO2_01_FULL_51_18]OGJ69351.1 MAG: hypothetical protein A3J34_01245 [Candidatus Peribacteria bacterium RIFCSPLOWO2_02_FULL_51_10]
MSFHESRLIFRAPDSVPSASERESQLAEYRKQTIREKLKTLRNNLPPIENMHYRADGLLDSFRFNGYSVDCSKAPLEYGETISTALLSLQKVTRLIESKRSIAGSKDHITIILNAKTGFDLIVQEGGKEKHYVATTREVLLVTEEHHDFSSEEERRKLPDLQKQLHVAQEKNDLSEENWKLIDRLFREVRTIRRKMDVRLVRDEETNAEVRQYDLHEHPVFERALGGGMVQQDAYELEGLRERTILRNGQPERSEGYRGDTLVARHSYKEGKLERTDHIQIMNDKERITHVTQHSNGEVLFPVSREGKRMLLSPFGESPLSSTEMEEVMAHLNTKEEFDFFEEIYWKNIAPLHGKNDALRDAVLKKGRILYGVEQNIQNLESYLNERGVPFQVRLDPSIPEGSRVKMREIAMVLPQLLQAVGTYPASYLKKGLRTLYILGNLQMKKLENPVGFYDSDRGIIVMSPLQHDGESVARMIFHHEYFHFSDDTDISGPRGSLDWRHRFHGDGMLPDGENVYGKFQKKVITRDIAWTSELSSAGFARPYGRLNPKEDRATIAEALLDPLTFPDFRKKTEGDPLLREKVAAIKRTYFVRSSGRMDEQFWKDVDSGVRIDPAYWQQREGRGDFNTDAIHTLERYAAANEAQKTPIAIRSFSKEYFTEGRRDENREAQVRTKWRTLVKDRVRLNPYDRVAWVTLRETYDFCNQESAKSLILQEQIALFEMRLKVLPVQDHEPSYYSELARLYVDDGKTAQAKECYERASKLFPHDVTLQRAVLQK